MLKKAFFLLLLLVLALGTAACFDIRVESDVDFPAARFSSARERIVALPQRDPHRGGEAGALHMLVYDGPERELVSGSLPMWLMKMGAEKDEAHGGKGHGELAGRYVDFDSCVLHELSRLGAGLLVQVDDEKDGTHVLLWLE